MDEWLTVADASGRAVPFMWVGPNAAGHLKPPGQIMSEGNNALWHYTIELAKEARSRQVEPLGMYNLTLQASSWDGSYYGSRVALVQAMMVRYRPRQGPMMNHCVDYHNRSSIGSRDSRHRETGQPVPPANSANTSIS